MFDIFQACSSANSEGNVYCTRGSTKNYDTVLRGRGQGVCDDSTEAVVIKSVTMGEGVQTLLNLRDVIYERPPLMKVRFIKCEYILVLECLIISVAKVKM